VLDNAPSAVVTVEIDGAVAGALSGGVARPDVCAVYPAYAGCPNVGFAGQIATDGLSTCPHLARVVATDSDGNKTILGERIVAPQ
jgi:hypothetical protein